MVSRHRARRLRFVGPVAGVRYIRDIFAMLPKGQSKTTYVAGLLIVALRRSLDPASIKASAAVAVALAPTSARYGTTLKRGKMLTSPAFPGQHPTLA
jgi:hypothetical protein